MKKKIIILSSGAAVFLAAVIVDFAVKADIFWLELTLYLISFLLIGGDVLYKAFRNILRGKVFDENFLMTIAAIGAFAIQEFPEAVAVMLFYQIGEIFQHYAVGRSRRSIAELMDIRPDYTNLMIDGEVVKSDPDEAKIGDFIMVYPGEKVPLDGHVTDGFSSVDTSALTGESVPRSVREGDAVLSGFVNLNGVLTVEVEKEFGESTASKILDLVENASSNKSKSENFITKFAKYYTPIVVIVAVLLAVIPPLAIKGATFSDWIYRALSFLVVSCPCALVVSIPMSFFGGIGGASKLGILVKGGNYLEALAKTETIVFDKTGTLTKGIFKVQKMQTEGGVSSEMLLKTAAYAEAYSSHPIAISIKEEYGEEVDKSLVGDVEEIHGFGISAVVEGKAVHAGNLKLMKKIGALPKGGQANESGGDISKRDNAYDAEEGEGTVVYVAVDGEYIGRIEISDQLKDDSVEAIRALKDLGVKKTVMLTGDNEKTARSVAGKLGIDEYYASLLPADKVEKAEQLLAEKSPKSTLVFVGDGINDAPVLARADIGIAMGALGSDAAIEAADLVIMTDEPKRIADAIKISKKTKNIATQNIVFALGVKLAVLVLSALGLTTMWLAVFADVGVAVLAILNAFRALSVKKLR